MLTVAEHDAKPLYDSQPDLVARDAADLLYGHARGGLAITALAAAVLTVALDSPERHGPLMLWFGTMVVVMLIRAYDLVRWFRTPEAKRGTGKGAIRRYSTGSLASAALWALLPLMFFLRADPLLQATMATILAGMAGGSITVLAAARTLALVYCAALLLPTSTLMLIDGSREHVFTGALGYAFFVVMAMSSRVTHRAILSASRLNRTNLELLAEMQVERARTEDANRGLREAKAALIEANLSLEDRIRARTEALEREVREKERYSAQLAELASLDPLTGLHNRATLGKRMETLIQECREAGEGLAVMFIDLDQFKEVNDVMGHFAGDQVLRTVAERLRSGLPEGTEVARWGGDEFVAVVRGGMQRLPAQALGRSIRNSLAQPIPIAGETIRIDATIGLAYFPDHGDVADSLIRSADVAMYAAKSNGERDVRVFDPSLAERLRDKHELGQALRDAIAGNGLRVEFQPIVAAGDGHCAGMEVLVRWDHAERGTVGPSEFIPIAESSGTIVPLGRWVLSEACRAAAQWRGTYDFPMSVNASVAQLLSGTIVDDVASALHENDLDGDRLHLEVTESLFAGQRDEVASVLAGLRDLGVRITIDDFGTGFSSLAYLGSLPVDIIKIDRAFVSDIETGARPIVEAIVSIARSLHFGVVAEGVETEEQQRELETLGVHYHQGFHFARPMDFAAASNWLASSADGSHVLH